jgi:ankyrin repeat protein
LLSYTTESLYPGRDAVRKLLLADVRSDPSLELKHNEPKPLVWAAQGEHAAVVELLLVSMQEPSGYILLQAAERGYTSIVRLLMQRSKVNVDFQNEKKETALWLAAQKGHEAIVRLLLETGRVDVEHKDAHGDTPFSRAVNYEREAVGRLLLGTGKVDVNTKDSYGQPLLVQSATMGHEAMVRLLLETGKVEIDAKDSFGQTALAHAASKGHESVVRLLLNTGQVDVHSQDTFGHTPLSRLIQEQEAPKLTQEELDRVENEFGNLNEALNTGKGHETIIALLRKFEPKSKAMPSPKTSRSRSVVLKLKRIGHGM